MARTSVESEEQMAINAINEIDNSLYNSVVPQVKEKIQKLKTAAQNFLVETDKIREQYLNGKIGSLSTKDGKGNLSFNLVREANESSEQTLSRRFQQYKQNFKELNASKQALVAIQLACEKFQQEINDFMGRTYALTIVTNDGSVIFARQALLLQLENFLSGDQSNNRVYAYNSFVKALKEKSESQDKIFEEQAKIQQIIDKKRISYTQLLRRYYDDSRGEKELIWYAYRYQHKAYLELPWRHKKVMNVGRLAQSYIRVLLLDIEGFQSLDDSIRNDHQVSMAIIAQNIQNTENDAITRYADVKGTGINLRKSESKGLDIEVQFSVKAFSGSGFNFGSNMQYFAMAFNIIALVDTLPEKVYKTLITSGSLGVGGAKRVLSDNNDIIRALAKKIKEVTNNPKQSIRQTIEKNLIINI